MRLHAPGRAVAAVPRSTRPPRCGSRVRSCPVALGREEAPRRLGSGAEATLASEMRWLFFLTPEGPDLKNLEEVEAELSRILFVTRSGAGSLGEMESFVPGIFN